MALYGPDGKPLPVRTEPDPQAAAEAFQALVRLPAGVTDKGDHYAIDKAAMREIQRERARRIAVTTVPHTPKDMVRDVGGMAVAKGHGRWPHLTNELLRDVRERSPLIQAIHSALQYKVRRLCRKWSGKKGDVGFRVVHVDHNEPNAKPPEGFDRYVKQFERVLWSPCPSHDINTLGTFMSLLTEDLWTINHPVVEKLPSRIDPRRTVQWLPADGGIIWPTLAWIERWLTEHPNRWGLGYGNDRRMSSADMVDVVSTAIERDLHGAEYVLVRDGVPEAIYPRGKLIVAPIRNRTDVRFAGYPPSHVEQALAMISAHINAFDFNGSMFTKGMLAEFILGVPADMHGDDVDAFTDMFREATQGRAWSPPILALPKGSDGIQKVDLKPLPKDMGFESWMQLLGSMVATGIYRTHMSTIGGRPFDANGGSKLGGENMSEEISLANEEGLQGDIGHLIENVLNPLARDCHPHLRVIAEWGNYDPEKEAKVYQLRAQTDMTRNEVRMAQGAEPMGFWLPPDRMKLATPEEIAAFSDNIWNWPIDATYASAYGAAKQREQFAQQGQQQGQPPGDGYGGDGGDGYGGDTGGNDGSPYGQPGGDDSDADPGADSPEPPHAPAPPQPQPQADMAKAARTFHIHVHGEPR